MKKTALFSLVGIVSSVVFSGCCAQPCHTCYNQQPVQTVKYVKPATQIQTVQTVRYVTPCVAYGYNNQCVAW